MSDADDIAARFVEARQAARGFPDYPGALPAGLDAAYRVQKAAIGLWADRLSGWKVGRIAPALSGTLGADRFIGPIFARDIAEARGEMPFPAFLNGFAAFEAELVIILTADAPRDRLDWSIDDAAALAGPMHIAVEIAGSPLASINDLGPLATIAGFGNNNGLILGAEVEGWRERPFDSIVCSVMIDGQVAGAAPASAIPGTPLAALAFALGQAARMGFPLRRGDRISTGAITGVHVVTIGQRCTADFGALGSLACRLVQAGPASL